MFFGISGKATGAKRGGIDTGDKKKKDKDGKKDEVKYSALNSYYLPSLNKLLFSYFIKDLYNFRQVVEITMKSL